MKRFALVLVAMLMVVMVGACGTKEAGPVELTPTVPTQTLEKNHQFTDIETLFINYVTAVTLGYELFSDTVMQGIDEEGEFIDFNADGGFSFVKQYDRAVDFGGLKLTVGVSNFEGGDNLLAYAHEADNAQFSKFSDRARQAELLVAESFDNWDAEAKRALASIGDSTYVISVKADPDKNQVVIIMSKLIIAP